jgi:hypothetical protein
VARIVTVEALHMLKLIETAPSTSTVWAVQLQVGLTAVAGRSPTEDDVEPMAEVVKRMEDVRDVAVVLLDDGIAVAMSLVAADADVALRRGRHLAISAARYAGLGEAIVVRTRVVPAHGMETA